MAADADEKQEAFFERASPMKAFPLIVRRPKQLSGKDGPSSKMPCR
jgi:hypothetical protein